ncbi:MULTISPECIES: hypothetical protein [unclassified Mameliella]|uniref:hypothetical protein n=1 Tax=Mameliella sp. LZ-28 TaxID=2484146 RepID=UPI00143F51D9|nr:hypothetical protein [Mameliella sp. LZ-28]
MNIWEIYVEHADLRCPPKAEAKGSNPFGCAKKSSTCVERPVTVSVTRNSFNVLARVSVASRADRMSAGKRFWQTSLAVFPTFANPGSFSLSLAP